MNKILVSILLIIVSNTGIITLAQYANPNTNCDQIIRDTYQNNVRTSVTYVVTTENAQRCLADAGFYDYRDQFGRLLFTGKYGNVTERAAEAYLNRDKKTNQEEVKKAEAAKAEADRLAEQERQNLQKKADELKTQTTIESQPTESSSISSQSSISSSSTISELTPSNSESSSSNSQVALTGNTPIQDSREPASADKFLINSIYFLFALPFILFAISIIAAFLKVFKKPNE